MRSVYDLYSQFAMIYRRYVRQIGNLYSRGSLDRFKWPPHRSSHLISTSTTLDLSDSINSDLDPERVVKMLLNLKISCTPS